MTLLRWLSDLQLGDDQVGHFESPGYQAAGMKYFMFGSLENPDPIRVQGSIFRRVGKATQDTVIFSNLLVSDRVRPRNVAATITTRICFFRVFVGDAYFLTFI